MDDEARSVYPVEVEIRQRGGRRTMSGRFPYGRTATIRATGRVRKETFNPRAFRFAVEEEEREVNLLYGHDYNRPLASKLRGSLVLTDTDDALLFEADLPRDSEQPSWMRDAVLAVQAGLIGGLSPGFRVPPAAAVPGAERLVPEPGNPDVQIREISEALLFEMSLVSRPAYTETELDLRAWEEMAARTGEKTRSDHGLSAERDFLWL